MNNSSKLLTFATVTYMLFACMSQGGKHDNDMIDGFDSIVIQDTFPADSTMAHIHPFHTFEIKYLYLKSDEKLQAEINRVVLKGKLDSIKCPAQDIPKKLSTKIKEEYKQLGPIVDIDLPILAPYYTLEMEQIGNNHKFVSLQWVEHLYRGEANRHNVIRLASFDRERKQIITPADIFVEGYIEKVAQALQIKLMQSYNVNTMEALSEIGFFVPSEISPNDNFALTEQGIRYCFNPLEIAIYTMGHIFIELTWDELRECIRPGSIIEQYLES